jgi:hypothetical protein
MKKKFTFAKNFHSEYFSSTPREIKALHFELELECSSWNLSRNECFAIFEVRFKRHFFVMFRKFGIFNLPQPQKFYENFLETNQIFGLQKCHFWSDLDQKWQKLTIFGSIWTQFRSKQLKIWPLNRLEPTRFNQIWFPGQILSCLKIRSKQLKIWPEWAPWKI